MGDEDRDRQQRGKADASDREPAGAGDRGETELEIEVDAERDVLTLRPVIVLRREDAWAYTPEHRELLGRAHADSREGRVRTLNEDDLVALGD